MAKGVEQVRPDHQHKARLTHREIKLK